MSTRPTAAALVLADGTVFEGEHLGATPVDGAATGEVAVSYTHLTLPTTRRV